MEKIVSPCISICKTNPSTGYCYGCARTSEEKAIWKDENTTNEWKINNISDYYMHPIGIVFESFIPSFLRKAKHQKTLEKYEIKINSDKTFNNLHTLTRDQKNVLNSILMNKT